jgi:hypothetical protein
LIINYRIVLALVILVLFWEELVIFVLPSELFQDLIVPNVWELVIFLPNVRWAGDVANVSVWAIGPRIVR